MVLEVSLHDADWGSDGLQFLALEPRDEPLRAIPAEAPADAPVATLVSGLQLDSGFAYACRPNPPYEIANGGFTNATPATYVVALRAVRCALAQPAPSVSTPLALTLEVSLDGAQYNAGGAPFIFRPPATVAAFYPLGSPVRGGTNVTVAGWHLGSSSASPAECRIGASRLRATHTDVGSTIECLSAEAKYAGLLFGSADGRPLPDLSGIWNDSFGREVHVCTRDGAFAASIRSAAVSAVGLWDEQHSGYVGLWQQWRTSRDEPLAFGDIATMTAEDASRRHHAGFFRWQANRDAVGAALLAVDAEEAAAAALVTTSSTLHAAGTNTELSNSSTILSASALNVSLNTSLHADAGANASASANTSSGSGASVPTGSTADSATDGRGNADYDGPLHRLLAQLFPRVVAGSWSADSAARHFGSSARIGGHASGVWSATFTSPLPAEAMECASIRRNAPISAFTPPVTPTRPAHVAAEFPSAAASTATDPSVELKPLDQIAMATGTHLPFVLLGSAHLTHGALPGPPSPASPAARASSRTNQPRQYFELTGNEQGRVGAVYWSPHPALARHSNCREQLSVRSSVYIGEGEGGDGMSFSFGEFTPGELLHTLAPADTNVTLNLRGLLRLLIRRVGEIEMSFVLQLKGATLWSTVRSDLVNRWFVLQMALSGASTLHLAIDGASLLSSFALPSPGWNPGDQWAVGLGASTLAFPGIHAVSDPRGSCGDGATAGLPFYITADGWHETRHAASTGVGSTTRSTKK